jgi:hypothetical protein
MREALRACAPTRHCGGIRLTRKGRQENVLEEATSAVSTEKELYGLFVSSLEKEAAENEKSVLVCDTSALRVRGKWSNPDVTKLSIRIFPISRKNTVVCATYEVKQWRKWSVDSVYEAVSHSRFSATIYLTTETTGA